MRLLIGSFVVASATLLVGNVALAQDDSQAPPEAAPEGMPPPPDSAAPSAQMQQEAPPPIAIAPPVSASPGAFPPGQWVWTNQYGWTWMPYGEAYTYAPTEVGGDPYMYLYTPSYGWRWLAAPWVFGIGPHPNFGTYGWRHYGWYGHPWFGHPWYGYHTGYPHGYHGVVVVHRAPYYRPHAVVRVGPGPVRREVRHEERRQDRRVERREEHRR